MKTRRVVTVPVHPIQMPQVSESVRNEFRFMLYGGADPADKLWRQWDEGGRHCRRRGTRESPLAFAVTYLTGAMKPMRTPAGGVYSFSEYHVALCEEAKCWMKPDGRRIGMIAPRGIGKSFWTMTALPLWAIAHGHRNFFAGYSHSDKQAVQRLDAIRHELEHNELLQFDFPELALPTGKGSRNNSHLVNCASGRSFASNGLDAVTLGLRPGKYRPDILVIDDGEPDEGNYAKAGSKGSKEVRLKTIRDIVLPMNKDAVVVLSGTVVMHDSIGHDLVRAALGEPTADWIAQEKFLAMYAAPILDEGTPWERSIWPEWASLDELKEERKTNPDIYALHKANQPTVGNGQYWKREDFRYDRHFPLDHYVMYIDPAVVAKEGRDKTAITVVGADIGRHRASVMFAQQGHMDIHRLAQVIVSYKAAHAEIPLLDVYIETNQGGQLWLDHLKPLMPAGVRLHSVRTGSEAAATGERGKLARIVAGYAYYQAGNKVWHEHKFPELEAILTMYPNTRNDDFPDSLAAALRAIFEPNSHRCSDQCALRRVA